MKSGVTQFLECAADTKTGLSAPRVRMAPAVAIGAPHAIVMHAPASFDYAVWVPFVAAILGAIVGAAISWWALAWSTENERKRKKAQARRALQIEMLMNAQRLKTGAIVQRKAAERWQILADLQQRFSDIQREEVDVPELADEMAAIQAEMQKITHTNVFGGA